MSIQHRADWRKIFEDFETLRYTLDELGERTRIPLLTLQRASAGIVQNRFVGDRIIATWCHLTMKSMEFAPLLPVRPVGQPPPVPDPAPPTSDLSADIQSVLEGWARATSRQGPGKP